VVILIISITIDGVALGRLWHAPRTMKKTYTGSIRTAYPERSQTVAVIDTAQLT